MSRIVADLLGALRVFTGHVEGATRELASLEVSTLAKAFRGALVPQDPTDEPAEALLARLRAENSSTEKPKPRRRRSEAAE
jgi:type I restriction enzyme S subunit